MAAQLWLWRHKCPPRAAASVQFSSVQFSQFNQSLPVQLQFSSVQFSSVQSVQFSSVQFIYAMKSGGPEWGTRRLWAAQGVFRVVQSGDKDLVIPAASWIPGFTPLACSDRAFSGAGEWRRPISVQFSFSSVQFSYAMKPGGPAWGKWRLWAAQGVSRAVQSGAKGLDLCAAS